MDEQWGARWCSASCQRRRHARQTRTVGLAGHTALCLCALCTVHLILSKQRVAHVPLHPLNRQVVCIRQAKPTPAQHACHEACPMRCTVPSTGWTAGKAKVCCQASAPATLVHHSLQGSQVAGHNTAGHDCLQPVSRLPPPRRGNVQPSDEHIKAHAQRLSTCSSLLLLPERTCPSTISGGR